MEQLDKLIAEVTNTLMLNGIRRISYLPYKINIALSVIDRIGKSFEPKFELNNQAREVYLKLIQYIHADPKFPGDLTKGLLLLGPTGTGKTLAMKIMSVYRSIDDTKFIMSGKTYRMNYEVISVNDIVNGFMNNAFDGIAVYANRYITCLDDLGTEIEHVKYYGNDLDVISYIISERYAKRLLTFATSNFTLNKLEEKYGDRIFSRMHAMFNFIIMKDKDFRK